MSPPARTRLSLQCVCGNELSREADWGETGDLDLVEECEMCGERYVVTVTAVNFGE